MQNETVSTPPSQGGVFCSPPLARAGARFNTVPIQIQRVLNGDIKISSLDRARTREIEAAVNDAVAAFGSPRDFRIWAWYAHRIGLSNFLELFFEQQSILRQCRLRSPAAAFHARLQRFYAAYFGKKGGAK